MVDLFNYFRRETTEVNIGAVPLGGPNSIRVQSMTNTSYFFLPIAKNVSVEKLISDP